MQKPVCWDWNNHRSRVNSQGASPSHTPLIHSSSAAHLPCPVPMGAGRVSTGQALTSSLSRLSVPLSPGNQPSNLEQCKPASYLGVWADKKKQISEFSLLPAKEKPSPRSAALEEAFGQVLVSGAKGEAAELEPLRCSSRGQAATAAPRQRRERPAGISQQKKPPKTNPTCLVLDPAKKAALQLPQSARSPAIPASSCPPSGRLGNFGCLVEVAAPPALGVFWKGFSSPSLAASFHSICRGFLS